jgi:hypothetical protein
VTGHVVIRQRWVIVISSVFVLLRTPSFFEPTWYSDAGTYANIGWALNHGARLYIDVWDNKPPGTYWFSAFLIGHLPTPIAMPLASSLLTAVAALCVAIIGRTLGGAAAAMTATLSYVVVASLPNLDGNLFNAEICGATCVVLAMAIVLRTTSPQWRVIAGALVGVALLFKAVFAADVVIVTGVPAIMAMAQGRRLLTGSSVKAALAILAGSSLSVVAALLALLGRGELGPAITVLTRYDISYIAAYGGGGIAGVAGTVLTVVRILIPICAGVGFAVALARRRRRTAALLAWWLGWDVAAAMLSGRGFPHYVQQAEPVVCLALAVAAAMLWQRYGHPRLLAAAVVAAAVITCQLVLWIPSAEVALAAGRGLPGFVDDGVAMSKVPAYYAAGYRRLIDPSTAPVFDERFPANLTLQRAAVDVFDSHSSPGDRVFAWGSIPWAYVLSNRMPAGRYVTLNSAYYLDHSAQVTLLGDLDAHPPAVLIVEAHPTPEALLEFLGRHRYQRFANGVAGDDYWLLPKAP